MELPEGTILTFGLVLVRVSALVLAAPMFGLALPFSGARVGLIGVLALFAVSTVTAPVGLDPDPLVFGALALRETAIGLALALVLHAVVLAVRVGGELIGHEMAFNMATQVDPSGVNTPLITQMHEGLFLIGLFALDGHHLVVRALFDSFERAPIGGAVFPVGVAETLLRLVADMYTAGLTFAAPVLIVMVLVSVMIGLLGRAVPQINVMEVGFTLRILGALVAMFCFAPLLAPVMRQLHGALASGLDVVLGALEA
ncbi:MAG TPA: flagellar biosynthetic protein FliR [Planctomycetota bacterium]|nr:flagellar biosynthetic protein FliR [Planctomycetota bacterium]